MELVQPLEPTGEESPLARARLHRQLTVEETARRAGITAEEVRWLEEGRVYRFPRPDDALIATALYATALGLDNREARELAGLPVPPQPIERSPLPRLLVVGGVVIALAVFAALLLIPRSGSKPTSGRPERHSSAAVAHPGQRPERQRRHQLHAAGRKPYRRLRLQHQEGRPRGQLHVPADGGVLPTEVRGRCPPAREAARRRDEATSRRRRTVPAFRDRRAGARTGRIAPTAAVCAGRRASS